MLAMIISAPGKTGNGVHLYDPETNIVRVLDSAPAAYTDLAWRKEAPDLAAAAGKDRRKKDGSTYAVLAWTGIGKAERLRTYDPTADATFPPDLRTVSFRRLAWSDEGNALFFGMAKWDDKIAPAGRGSGGARGGRGAAGVRSRRGSFDHRNLAC